MSAIKKILQNDGQSLLKSKGKIQYPWMNMVAFILGRWSPSMPVLLCTPAILTIEWSMFSLPLSFGLAMTYADQENIVKVMLCHF